MINSSDERALTPVDSIVGGDKKDTRLLRAMAVEAREYITSFKWCLPIKAQYFADGYGGIVALFVFDFDGKIGGTDERLWVVVGDVPSAYMVVGGPVDAKDALDAYCELMDGWINAVLVTHSFDNVFPVEAARTTENAEDLRGRLKLIRKMILPQMRTDSIENPP